MSDRQKGLLYVVIFGIIFGSILLGVTARSDARQQPNRRPDQRLHKITRVVRNSDDYFAGMTDREVVRTGRTICVMLRNGRSISSIVTRQPFPVLPPADAGYLVSAAVSLYCPAYRPALQQFIAQHS